MVKVKEALLARCEGCERQLAKTELNSTSVDLYICNTCAAIKTKEISCYVCEERIEDDSNNNPTTENLVICNRCLSMQMRA